MLTSLVSKSLMHDRCTVLLWCDKERKWSEEPLHLREWTYCIPTANFWKMDSGVWQLKKGFIFTFFICYLSPDSSRMKRVWLGKVFSFRVLFIPFPMFTVQMLGVFYFSTIAALSDCQFNILQTKKYSLNFFFLIIKIVHEQLNTKHTVW